MLSRNNSVLILLLAFFAFTMSNHHFSIYILIVISTVSASADSEEPLTLRQALAQTGEAVKFETVTLPSASPSHPTLKEPMPMAKIALKQSYIWVSIILAVVLFFSVLALLNMDIDKEKDTILYAKFLQVSQK
jgi:ABC-type microcin C transport system permease subunit YejE